MTEIFWNSDWIKNRTHAVVMHNGVIIQTSIKYLRQCRRF
uniref:Uncharacterized protein n=1 Tax=Anguilla anguilla TaxID=7936 RepID=A0A0E9PIH3_ANGAN